MCTGVKAFDFATLCCEMFGITRFTGLTESYLNMQLFINTGCGGFEVINNTQENSRLRLLNLVCNICSLK